MNKLVFSLFLFVFICCENASKNEISVQNLQESFIAKNETEFLRQFPKDFDQFRKYYGWDSDNDMPQELYDKSNDYIDYWFDLLNNEQYKEYEKSIIDICWNGEWRPDAVNYFQDKSINYIKEKQKYNLINELESDSARSVLFFLFDSPAPQFDADFAANLSVPKEKILNEVFETALFDQDDIDYEDSLQSNNISFYTENDSYFSKDIDINNDGILDKIVSSKRYEGDELLLFVSKNNIFELALKTINFSEDGGNQITDIKKDENGFVIVTAFPDRGFFESNFFIAFNNGKWILTNTIYKTESSNQKDAFIYVCDVKQGIDIGSANLLYNQNSMPDESERDKTCLKEKNY